MDVTAGRLVIRADADTRIGTGHVMRCLALAQHWIDRKGTVDLLSHTLPENLGSRARAEGITVNSDLPPITDIGGTVDAICARKPDWVVVDSYEATVALLDALAGRGMRTLVLDDVGRLPQYRATLLLNQNLHAAPSLYKGRTEAGLLLGTRYALMRRDLRAGLAARQHADEARRLLMLVGGSDPDGVSCRLVEVARMLSSEHGVQVRLVLGPANTRAADVRNAARGHDGIDILQNVDAMAPLYRWCDLAVTAGGSTVWELAMYATPMVIGALADVEVTLAEAVAERGAALFLGRFATCEPEKIVATLASLLQDRRRRRTLGDAAHGLVDGNGVERVFDRMIGTRPIGKEG